MESASPEPSRSRGPRPTGGTAAQEPAASRAPTGGSREPADEGHVIRVADVQTDAVDLARLERVARHVLRALSVPAELELSITCVDAQRIEQLNETHLGGDGPTDVLAFPIDGVDEVRDGIPGLLGDVVVCPRVAAGQAGGHGRTPAAELDLLVVHGILHLLGHDHATDDERTRMFGLTDELLAGFAAAGGAR